MKHGNETISIVQSACLHISHVRLAGNCRVNWRATGAAEVATDGAAGIGVAVFVKRQISREFDVNYLKGCEG